MNNLTKFLYSKIENTNLYIKNAQENLDIIENKLYEETLYHSKNFDFIDKMEILKEKINDIELLIKDFRN